MSEGTDKRPPAPQTHLRVVAWAYEWKPFSNNNPWQPAVSLTDPRVNAVRDIRNVRALIEASSPSSQPNLMGRILAYLEGCDPNATSGGERNSDLRNSIRGISEASTAGSDAVDILRRMKKFDFILGDEGEELDLRREANGLLMELLLGLYFPAPVSREAAD